MHLIQLALLLPLPLAQAAETVLGVYIFSRHGDRTAKSTPPSNLTDLGYREVFDSGTWFRERYVSSTASSRIAGMNTDLVSLSQIAASAPVDNVLQSSAQGFLQGLYPPVGATLGSNALRNGTVVKSPLNGYQIIPVQTVTSGTASEDSAWLQGAGNCANAIVSSNNYYTSDEYRNLLDSTRNFYNSIAPVVNGTFSPDQTNYKNAYTIFDLINVASIHNATFPSSSLITPNTLLQLRTSADAHEFALAYNASSPIRAIAGATLAAQVLQSLNATITSAGKAPKMNIQFGAYGSFQSFFGLANLTTLNEDFYGVPDYASSMTFELFTTGPATPFPAASDLSVRFLFHNGTTSNSSTPTAYPLFGTAGTTMSWSDFSTGMNKFAVGGQAQWCQACGNSTGVCAASQSSSSSAASPTTGATAGDNGISKAVAGVIGAFVTLAVILGVEVLVMLLAGVRLVSKKRLGGRREEGMSPEPKA